MEGPIVGWDIVACTDVTYLTWSTVTELAAVREDTSILRVAAVTWCTSLSLWQLLGECNC